VHVAVVKAAGTGIALCRAQVYQSSNDETPQRAAPSGRTIMLTRRKFIGTTLVAGAALTTSAQQARPQPASKRTIVDARCISGKQIRRTGPGSRCQAAIAGAIHHRAALPMMDEAGVDRVVIVPRA